MKSVLASILLAFTLFTPISGSAQNCDIVCNDCVKCKSGCDCICQPDNTPICVCPIEDDFCCRNKYGP